MLHMLDLRFIRDNTDAVRRALKIKLFTDAVEKLDQLLLVDEEHRLLKRELEEKQAQRNSSSKLIGDLKRRGEDASELMREMSTVSEAVKRLEDRERSLQHQIDTLLLDVPNLPHESVPFGTSEHDNVVVKEWGDKPTFGFAAKPH